MNTDALGGTPKSFEELDEFVELCQVVGHSGTPPKLGGKIHPMGLEVVCLNAQITQRSGKKESPSQGKL